MLGGKDSVAVNCTVQTARSLLFAASLLCCCSCIHLTNNGGNGNPPVYLGADSSLTGYVKGTLGENRSVYYLGHAKVRPGDTLRILAGTRIWADNRVDSLTNARRKSRLDVDGGVLICDGRDTSEGNRVEFDSSHAPTGVRVEIIKATNQGFMDYQGTYFTEAVDSVKMQDSRARFEKCITKAPIITTSGCGLEMDSCTSYRRVGAELRNLTNRPNRYSILHSRFALTYRYRDDGICFVVNGDSAFVEGNIFYSTSGEGSDDLLYGIAADEGSRGWIVGNTFWIEIPMSFPSGARYNWVVKNNISIGKRYSEIDALDAIILPFEMADSVRNNNFWGKNYNGHYVRYYRPYLPDTTIIFDRLNANGDSCDANFNFSADPLFIDHSSFMLSDSSPCIGAGENGIIIGAIR